MIEKIIHIKGIGRFNDYTPRGDVSFRKLTLLFAENGMGKTTLCSILRSLMTGDPSHISERKTLGLVTAPAVQFRVSGNNISFSAGAWSATLTQMAIFDSVFIHDNVFAGDYVDHDQKKNLYRIVVGERGVGLAQKIEALDTRIRESNDDIRKKKSAVSAKAPQGTTVDEYVSWQGTPNIDEEIRKKKEEIASLQLVLDRGTEIQAKGLLSSISAPSLPDDLTTILAEELSDVTSDAESRVRDQIAQHQMEEKGETWLSDGIKHVTNDLCPFCGQDVRGNALVLAYRTHFNDAYKLLKEKVAGLETQITKAIGESALDAVQLIVSQNMALLEFWKQIAKIQLPVLDIQVARKTYSHLLEMVLLLAHKKQQCPIDAVVLPENVKSCLAELKGFRGDVDAYNSAVDECNVQIRGKKAATPQGNRIKVLNGELSILEGIKGRFEPEAVQACQVYQEALTAKTALEAQKEVVKGELDTYCRTILKSYEQTINKYLDQFGAGFRIVNTRHLYTGGTPSSHYQIQVNNTAVDLGDARGAPGVPCFKTVLSAGDRSALALAFFLAVVSKDPQIASRVLVFDDPFTSLDRFRRACTEQLLRQIANDAHQTIVLSHDPFFLKLLWDGFPSEHIKCLQLLQTANGSVLGDWNIEAETQSEHVRSYSTLLKYYRERVGDHRAVGKTIRPFCEGLFRVRFPGHFQPNEWLGNFIDKIREAQETDGLALAKHDLPELEAINEYSKKFHHAQNENTHTEMISADELYGFVKRTLRLVGGINDGSSS